jgi:hypothetical protein
VGLKIKLNKNTMRYRPKRENYAIGQFGEIDYQEMLERYCTYLENKNKQLRLHVVSNSFSKEDMVNEYNKGLRAGVKLEQPH